MDRTNADITRLSQKAQLWEVTQFNEWVILGVSLQNKKRQFHQIQITS